MTAGPVYDEALTVGAAQGIGEQTQASPVSVTDLDAARKGFTNIAAQLALMGYALYELSCGGYLIARWDRNLHCSDLNGVRAFYQRIGGAA